MKIAYIGTRDQLSEIFIERMNKEDHEVYFLSDVEFSRSVPEVLKHRFYRIASRGGSFRKVMKSISPDCIVFAGVHFMDSVYSEEEEDDVALPTRTLQVLAELKTVRVILLSSSQVYGNSDELSDEQHGFMPEDERGMRFARQEQLLEIEDAAEEVRLILLAFDLEDYTEEELPEEKLEELRAAMDVAKEEHMAVIFRAAYGFHREVEEPERMEVVERHIHQISEVLNSYRDLILVVQAGILGEYGEWHSSRYLEGTEEEKRESRLHILRQWELYLDPDIRVDVRRPRFVREAAAEGILAGRLGVHNDALLSTDSDMGTYDAPGMEREDELAWMQENLLGQVNGGEMPTPGELNAPENAHREFAQQHTGYLNLKYNEEIIDGWAAMTMEDMDAKSYLENHLGYRLFLTELGVRRFYFAGKLPEDGVQMHIGLCNSGYAPLMEKYKVFVTIGSGENLVVQEIGIPELYRICNGQSVEKDITVRIPEEFLDGKEKISIGLKIAPNMDEKDGQDCVELANQNFIYRDGVNRIVSLDREGEFLFRTVR